MQRDTKKQMQETGIGTKSRTKRVFLFSIINREGSKKRKEEAMKLTALLQEDV